MDDTKAMVINVIEDLCAVKVEDVTQRLIEDLAMDSLRMVMLLIMLEDAFDVELDESDLNPFSMKTVDDVIILMDKYSPQTEEICHD